MCMCNCNWVKRKLLEVDSCRRTDCNLHLVDDGRKKISILNCHEMQKKCVILKDIPILMEQMKHNESCIITTVMIEVGKLKKFF